MNTEETPAQPIRIKVTLLADGIYYRATIGPQTRIGEASKRHGILIVGKNCLRASFNALKRQGKLQEISQDQALRLQSMLPKAKGTSPNDYPPRKHKGKEMTLRLEKVLLDGIRALAQRRGIPMAKLVKSWVRTAFALEMDKERTKWTTLAPK